MDLEQEIETVQSIFLDDLGVQLSGDNCGTHTLSYSMEGQPILTLHLNNNYPKEAPQVVFPDHLQSLELKEHIAKCASSLVGSPMLFEILEAARDWITSHPLCLQTTPPRHTATEAKKPSPQICKFYLDGKCKFGSNCRLLHPGSISVDTEATSSTENDTHTPNGVQSKVAKKVQNAAVTSKPIDDEAAVEVKVKPKKAKPTKQQPDIKDETGKKTPMRTATEVISRILWDPDLPSEEFCVGYLDRFLGVMEKPFSAFSWEDISTVGASVLAIPKHRIQYFKFRDEIVWDKPSQVDDFFGSRGGKVIQDIVAKHLSNSAKSVDDKDNGDMASVREDPTTNQDIEARIELEIEEDGSVAHSRMNKDRPTHFVCFHITDAKVKEKVQQIQDHIINHTPQLADGCLSIATLHITLCMLRLDNEQQVDLAKQVLQNVKNQFIHILPRCLNLSFTGVDNFHGRLVHAKVASNHALDRFVSHLIEQLKHAGVRTPGNFDVYTPHMTLVKLSRPMQRELHTTVVSPSSYIPFQQSALGTQMIEAIHLCSIRGPAQSDGFFLRLSSVSNSLSGLVPTISSLLQARLQMLTTKGILSETDYDRLSQGLQSGGNVGFDVSIEELLQVMNEEHVASNSSQTVVILRGLPGSGKSFLSRNCLEVCNDSSEVVVCAADEYFMDGDSYRFDPNTLPKAHSYCLSRFLTALNDGKQLIIIDNTNSRRWEYLIYTYLCDILGLRYHILEVPCPNAAIAEMFCARNVHNIDSPVASKIFSHWEKDEHAVLITPEFSYPRARLMAHDSFSLLSLCQPDVIPEDTLASYSSLTAVYTGVFLTAEAQWELVAAFSPTHPSIHCNHITLKFDPTLRSILRSGVGKTVTLRVTGCVDNGKVQVALVQLPRGVESVNVLPHVTISTEPGTSSKVANEVLRTHHVKPVYHHFTVEGVIGLVVRETHGCDLAPSDQKGDSKVDLSKVPKITVTSESDLQHHILPKLLQKKPSSDEEVLSGDDVASIFDMNICTGLRKITQLFIYDFDGTLFTTPEPKQGKELYEKITGKKWEHKGWLSWPESLLPPLKTTPGPALAEYRQNLGKSGSHTMVLTARIKRTEEAVRMVLENNQVYPHKLILKPDSMDETSANFKVRMIKDLLEEFPDVTLVKFWDDSASNLASVQHFSKTVAKNVHFEIVDATRMLPVVVSKQGKKMAAQPSIIPSSSSQGKRGGSVLESHLESYGWLPSQAYISAATTGLNFLALQFCKLIDFQGDCRVISYPFGSFVLGRQSDVDVCFLAPASFTVKQCVEQLAQQLEDCGINYIHRGFSTRCPRLKVMLEFSNSPPVNYDVVFTIVGKDDFFQSPPKERLPTSEVTSMLKSGDSPSKVAYNGPIFLQQVEEILQTSPISQSQFGAVIEMVVQVLTAQRQKGNAYHCIRTFHVVRLLADFISSRKSELPVGKSDCDSVFKDFVGHLSKLPEAKWQKIFGEFVPAEFIPRLQSVFAAVTREVSYPDFPSQTCYEEMKTRPPFPPEGHTLVELKLSGSNSVTLWKLHTIVEARLPSYIRQLLSAGINVFPDGNVRNEKKFCFAVPQAKASKHTLQQILRPFWNEIAEYRKQSGVKIELTFGAEMQEAKSYEKASHAAASGQKESDIASVITKFAAKATERVLDLSPSLSSYERRIAHETAERLGLEHTTVGEEKGKHVALRKKD